MRKASVAGLIVLLLCAGNAWAQLGDDTPDVDERVREILKARDINYTVDKDGDFKVTFDMGNGRTQLAFVISKTHTYRNLEVREIWACGYRSSEESGDFPASVANQLLEDTFSKKLGAWAKMGSVAVFVVKISASADEETLMSALNLAVNAADEMEEKLSGDTDEF